MKPIVTVTLFILTQICILIAPAVAEIGKVWRRGDPPPKEGWLWPKLEEVMVYGNMDLDENGSYVYSYTIYNSTKNRFSLYRFEVDLRNNPAEHPFTNEHVTLTHDMHAHRKVLDNAARITPLHILRPDNWNRPYPKKWEQKRLYAPIWVADEPALSAYQIQPGAKLSGLHIIAKEPPGIREFIVDAADMEYFDAMSLPPEKAYLAENLDKLNLEINKGTTYSSKTIAPVAPPEPFTVSSWTARIESDAMEARALGWINTDDTLAEIKKLISGLNTEDKGKLKTAVKRIETYISTEKKKGNLTDETDALIRLNALYLLHRLEKPEAGK